MHDLVVVGAGPYGLSVAAHAAAAKLDVRVLGRPMASWRDHMPRGMYLKTEPWATDLSDAAGERPLRAFCRERGVTVASGQPVALETFAAYGLWFADGLGAPVEERMVTSVAPQATGFRVETSDGEAMLARNVVLAAGLRPLIRVPEVLRELFRLRGGADGLVSHSTDHHDLSVFEGRDVAVIGAGQSALETAALLAEHGAAPVIIARGAALRWDPPPLPPMRGLAALLRAPQGPLGAGWAPWLWARAPWAVRRFPAVSRAYDRNGALGPSGAWWLRDRVRGVVPVRLAHRLLRAWEHRGRVRLEMAAGEEDHVVVETGHVIAATGFAPQLRRLRVLDPALREGLARVRGTDAPRLSPAFESSHPGLFFAGPLAAPSFGPAMRFVCGAAYAAPRTVRGVRRRLEGRPGKAAPRAGRR
jgi:hypothetical protein